MFAEYLSSLDGVVSLGIVSLLASIAIFAAVIWRTLRITPASVHLLEQLPLDDGERSCEHTDEVTP